MQYPTLAISKYTNLVCVMRFIKEEMRFEVILGFVIRKVNYALYNVLINTLEAKITYYGSRLLFKFHY